MRRRRRSVAAHRARRPGAGDDADAARKARQGALARGEQAFALQSFLQLHEGGVEVAHAGAADGFTFNW
jgi:hypothetical protein